MEMLPPSLGNLKSLKQLILFGGKWKCLLDCIGKLKQLTDLTIDCGRIKYLPADVRELNNLEILKVIKCPLSELPFGRVGNGGGRKAASVDQSGLILLDSLLRLKHLDLQGTRIEELSFAEGVCPNLSKLDIGDCLELVEVGALRTTLISLDLDGCDALKKVTGLRGLAALRELDIRKCEIVELSGLERLTSLVHLRASGCRKLKNIRGLTQVTNFQIYLNLMFVTTIG
jgi:Leucine-rich repeat (LRR) protein